MTSTPQKTLYLVDASSLFFRAYYAISSHLISTTGMPTNALYGLLSMTLKFIKENQVEHMVYCFDRKDGSFRNKLYSKYKANRDEMPEDLQVQIPYIKQLVEALGIPMIERKGYEADDLIGSLAITGKKKKYNVVIVSGDKDFAQIVSPGIILYDPMKEVSYDSFAVQHKWGVTPDQINDYLALVGDSSDNIPGVYGIGPKGAQKLLQEYKTLEGVYKNLDKIQNKNTQVKLKSSKKEAFLSQKLARIVIDLNLEKSINSFKREEQHTEKLKNLLKELDFKNFEKRLFGKDVVLKKGGKARFLKKKLPSNLKLHTLSSEELKELIPSYGVVLVFLQDKRYFLAYKNKVIDLQNHSLTKVGQLFSERRIKWSGYDLKKIWSDFKCTHPIPYWCTLIAAYLIESGAPGSFEQLVLRYLKEDITEDLEPGEIYRLHKKLFVYLKDKLEELNMLELYKQTELPLVPVLYEMELQGIMIDEKELKKQATAVNRDIKQIEKEIFNHTKNEFNLSSPKQMAEVLFTDLGLKPIRKTKSGYSTDMEVLNKLKTQHPVISCILKHRELFKLKTTYLDALLSLIKKGRVHTHFRQALTSTGRLSSINPNLQNIPIRSERGRNIRKAFIAPPKKKIISADYSQIELRVLAHYTGDPALCSAFQKDLDIHTATASEIYGISLEKVTSDQRQSAKAINFGLIYGQGPYTLADSLGISVAEATDIIKSYFDRFKKIKEYMDSMVKQAYAQGYVETLMGRRRMMRELSSKNFPTKKGQERAAINAPIQGTASDLVKLAMVELRNSLYSPILLQIHDELLFECPDHLVEEEICRIREIMENVASWKVPLKVQINVGQDWQSAHS